MRRAVLGARQTNEAAYQVVGRRCMVLSRLHNDGIPNVCASISQKYCVRRYGSKSVAASELRSAGLGDRISTGTLLKHPMSRVYLGPFSEVDQEALRSNSQDATYPVIPPGFYDKWRSLSLNNNLLRIESDVNSPGAGRQLLVDQPGNENDILLWTILLRYRCQRMGLEGAAMIWNGVNKRRTLHEVHGIVAEAFWQTILNSALQDRAFLESVWLYAIWLDESYGVKVPKLYTTIISALIRQKRGLEALLWHVRLISRFDPGQAAFARLIKTFIAEPDDKIRNTLKELYIVGHHRKLYDELMPYIYYLGKPLLADHWRQFLLLHNDLPTTTASRRFLKYLAAYYPQKRSDKSERSVAGLETEEEPNFHTTKDFAAEEQLSSGMIDERPLSYLINRVHGETFGIQEKSLNDEVGARWFASSWISLDFAITAVHALGIISIGPLSLQSIALRENSAAEILSRITQLQGLKIGIGSSRYSKAIRYLARNNDYETLQGLLRSDLHPDVFESKEMQATIFHSCMLSGEWTKYHLIGMVNLAASVESAFLFSNQLLLASIADGNKQMILQILNDMRSRNVDIFPSTSHAMTRLIRESTGIRKGDLIDFDYLLALSRQLARTRFPPAARVWEKLLWHLGRNDRIEDFESLALEVTRLYTSWHESKSTAVYFHRQDVPKTMRDGSPYTYFQSVPREIPINHALHPLQTIFSSLMQKSLVRYAFNYELRNDVATSSVNGKWNRLSDFYIARGVRLLRLLNDQGVRVHPNEIKKAVLLRLADMYGPTIGPSRGLEHSKQANRLTLPEVKQLFDDAWGKDLLGPVSAIEQFIVEEGDRRFQAEYKYQATKQRSRQNKDNSMGATF